MRTSEYNFGVIYGVSILNLIFVLLSFWVVYLVVEAGRSQGYIKGEAARKAIHIGVGIILATLPTFMLRREIVLVNVSFLVGMIVLSGMLHLFTAYEDVKRWTIGQYLYPIGVVLVTIFFKDPLVYSFSVLVLAFADGFAALVGQWHGGKTYHIPGGEKTLFGSLTFFAVTATIFSIYVVTHTEPTLASWVMVPTGAAFVTAVEGLISRGFDNLFIPLSAALILHAL